MPFLKSVLQLASVTASSIPQPMPTPGDQEAVIVPTPVQVYSKCFKKVTPTSLPTDPVSIAAVPESPTSLLTNPALPVVETDTSVPSDLDHLIAL